jgi:putative membrane protein
MLLNIGGMMDYGGYGGFGVGMALFGWLFMILFWVAIILLIIWLYKQIKGPESAAAKTETANEILKKRYARGEINKEEFEEKKKDLL